MYIKSRWRNYGLWVSVASLALLLAKAFGLKIHPEEYNAIVNTILGILLTLGILSDPTTDNRGYKDD